MPFQSSASPTRGRFILALWLCGLAAVLYLDRICLSQAVPSIQAELKLTNTDMSYVMMAFTLAYGLFEIPVGRMGDRYGSRSVLTRIVIWWSVFTALTGVCSGLWSLIFVRFMFGAGEAGTFPNTACVITRWFPVHERGRMQGVMLSFAQLGAVAAPVGTAALISAVGWRWSFACFAAIGIVWAIGFAWWFRDDPGEHPGVNAAELEIIQADGKKPPTVHQAVPWGLVVANYGIWILCSIVFCAAFFTYFFYSWFPKYLKDARGFGDLEAGWVASAVLLGSAIGTIFGGWLTDRIPQWTPNPLRLRQQVSAGCFLLAAISLHFGIQSDQKWALTLLCGTSICVMNITMPIWWSVVMPQCGKHVGALCGLMNGSGSAGAILSQGFVGFFSDWRAKQGLTGREQWDAISYFYVGALILAAVGWWAYRRQALEEE